MSDEPLVYCPECDEASLKKMISAAAFHLKGPGTYETDFKHGNKAADASKDTTSTDKSSKATEPKAEKPATSSTGSKSEGGSKAASSS